MMPLSRVNLVCTGCSESLVAFCGRKCLVCRKDILSRMYGGVFPAPRKGGSVAARDAVPMLVLGEKQAQF